MFIQQWRCNSNMQTGHYCPESEANKVLVSHQTYTVASPWTMVIHSHDALFTDGTVMCSWWFEVIALLAYFPAYEAVIRGINIDREFH